MHTITMVLEIDEATANQLRNYVNQHDTVWLCPDGAHDRDDGSEYFEATIKHFGQLPDNQGDPAHGTA